MTKSMILAGFGGQGILFAAKQLAKTGMQSDKNVTWLPSYGPEMRGGTANCSVIISDEEIGAPIISNPDILVAFNIQAFDKFESRIVPDGILFADSTLITKKSERSDITAYYIPATGLAADNGITGSANVIMLGYIIKKTGIFDYEFFLNHMIEGIPESKAALIERNKKAFDLGYYFE